MTVSLLARCLDALAAELPLASTHARLGPLEWWSFHLPGGFLVVRLHYGKRLVGGDLPLYFRAMGRFDAHLERHTLSSNQPSYESPRTEIALEELSLEAALGMLEAFRPHNRKAA